MIHRALLELAAFDSSGNLPDLAELFLTLPESCQFRRAEVRVRNAPGLVYEGDPNQFFTTSSSRVLR